MSDDGVFNKSPNYINGSHDKTLDMNIEPNSAREDRVKNLAKMLLKSRSNTMNELVLRTNKLQKIVDRKKSLNLKITERESSCLRRLCSLRHDSNNVQSKSEHIFEKIISAVEANDNDALNAISILPNCDLPPTDVEEDLYLDKMIEDHLERRKNGEFFESTTGIRLADIIHAVEVERGNIKDNKKGTKKKATKSKAVKRPTQAPAAKPEVKRSRQRREIRSFPPSMNQYVRGFFNVLRIVLLDMPVEGEGLVADRICDLIHNWQSNSRAQRTNSPWINRCPDWSQVVRHALVLLSGGNPPSSSNLARLLAKCNTPTHEVSRLIPTASFVSMDPDTQMWYWEETGLDDDSETALLARLFTLWAKKEGGLHEVMRQLMLDNYGGQPPPSRRRQEYPVSGSDEEEDEEELEGSGVRKRGQVGRRGANFDRVPPPYFPTEWQCKLSTIEQRRTFQTQEAERYSRPWSPYVYNQHGYASVVGPVRSLGPATANGQQVQAQRGVRGAMSARDHPLLRPDRPSWVSISEIVRDAVARLPNGEGTRPEIAILAQDSGYLVSGFSPRQLSQCISSALDRLQGEGASSPVMYDSVRRLWIYRYRHLSPPDFYRLYKDVMAVQRERFNQMYPDGLVVHPKNRRSSSTASTSTAATAIRQSQHHPIRREHPHPPHHHHLDDRYIPDIDDLTREDDMHNRYDGYPESSSEDEEEEDDAEYYSGATVDQQQQQSSGFFSQPRRMTLDYRHSNYSSQYAHHQHHNSSSNTYGR